MARNAGISVEKMQSIIDADNPYKPGTLIAPRLGYFYPDQAAYQTTKQLNLDEDHPCGLILGPALVDNYLGRELYRVRFGDYTHEKVHPAQMEII